MHVRCPHCHNAIEIVSEHELRDIACPSCGSTFNLLPETESWTPTPTWMDHFQLLDKLGTGGFGTVWKARDTKLDRLVAVKIPRRSQVSPAEEETFLREARAAAQLRHPSIVAVHEVGRQDSGDLYIVSDFVQGVTLADRLASGPFTPREAAELCAKIAEALHHAHESGVIHRDLKPSNIMLDGDGTPHLMDFGLAKREAGEITMTVEGKLLGTPAYMSPEQARGEGHHVDRRTDVYSLGVILFELLTGERPFRGNQRMLLHQVINDEPARPRKLNIQIPRDLETICLKCMEKECKRRYASAVDVADELRRYLDGKPIVARPVSTMERGWRWAKRNQIVAGLSVALTMALMSITILFVWFSAKPGGGSFTPVPIDTSSTPNKAETIDTRETAKTHANHILPPQLSEPQARGSYLLRVIEPDEVQLVMGMEHSAEFLLKGDLTLTPMPQGNVRLDFDNTLKVACKGRELQPNHEYLLEELVGGYVQNRAALSITLQVKAVHQITAHEAKDSASALKSVRLVLSLDQTTNTRATAVARFRLPVWLDDRPPTLTKKPADYIDWAQNAGISPVIAFSISDGEEGSGLAEVLWGVMKKGDDDLMDPQPLEIPMGGGNSDVLLRIVVPANFLPPEGKNVDILLLARDRAGNRLGPKKITTINGRRPKP